MATAKKLEFQAERKAAAWQGGKPQPAPLPADVHAATYLVDSDGEAARTAYPVFPGIEIAYHDVHAASAAHAHRLPIWRCLLFSRAGRSGDRAARGRSSPGALSDRALPWHHGDDRPGARAGLPVVLSRGR